jgi:hypothetical protein
MIDVSNPGVFLRVSAITNPSAVPLSREILLYPK